MPADKIKFVVKKAGPWGMAITFIWVFAVPPNAEAGLAERTETAFTEASNPLPLNQEQIIQSWDAGSRIGSEWLDEMGSKYRSLHPGLNLTPYLEYDKNLEGQSYETTR
jgi:hypothetical protein